MQKVHQVRGEELAGWHLEEEEECLWLELGEAEVHRQWVQEEVEVCYQG